MQTVVAKNSAAALTRRDGDRLSLPPTFFDVGPTRELTLDQFECLAIDRLQLLRSIEMLKARGFEDKELAGKIREVSLRLASRCRCRVEPTVLRDLGGEEAHQGGVEVFQRLCRLVGLGA